MNTQMLLVIVGLIVTAFGVGGVESSITDGELALAVLVSLVGLGIMGTGVRGLNRYDYLN